MQSVSMNTWCYLSIYRERNRCTLCYICICVFPSSVCKPPVVISLASISWFLTKRKEKAISRAGEDKVQDELRMYLYVFGGGGLCTWAKKKENVSI